MLTPDKPQASSTFQRHRQPSSQPLRSSRHPSKNSTSCYMPICAVTNPGSKMAAMRDAQAERTMPRQKEWFGSILLCNALRLQRALRKTFRFTSSRKRRFQFLNAELHLPRATVTCPPRTTAFTKFRKAQTHI